MWAWFGLVLCLSAGFLTILFRHAALRENSLLLLISYLLEHGYHLTSKVMSLRTFNIFMTTFLLMGIVLTNAYKGIVITDITAPLKENHNSTIEDAVKEKYTLVTPNPFKQMFLNILVKGTRDKDDEGRLSNLTEEAKFQLLDNLVLPTTSQLESNFGKIAHQIISLIELNEERVALYMAILAMMDTWKEREVTLFVNGTEYEFLKCNKTILVDTKEELNNKYVQLIQRAKLSSFGRDNKDVALNIGKDTIVTASVGIPVSDTKWDRGIIPNRMSRILSSGIYHQLKKMERSVVFRLNARLDANSCQPSSLNLNSNILTLFAIYCCFLGFSLLWLTIEWLYSVYPKYRYCGIRLFQTLSQIPVTVLGKMHSN